MAKALFITGTGTDVGKTFVTGLIVKKLKDSGKNAAYYKAAMSGNVRRPDQSLIPWIVPAPCPTPPAAELPGPPPGGTVLVHARSLLFPPI